MKDNIGMERELTISEGVSISIHGDKVHVNGPKGSIERKIIYPGIKLSINNNKVLISSKKSSRKFKRLIGTMESHIRNLIYGVIQGYTYKLKICSGHFPMKVTLSHSQVIISNFLGEKIPRKANIISDVNVKLDNDFLIVEGLDKEKTGQTAANIENATRITNRDRRVFQDGIYMIK